MFLVLNQLPRIRFQFVFVLRASSICSPKHSILYICQCLDLETVLWRWHISLHIFLVIGGIFELFCGQLGDCLFNWRPVVVPKAVHNSFPELQTTLCKQQELPREGFLGVWLPFLWQPALGCLWPSGNSKGAGGYRWEIRTEQGKRSLACCRRKLLLIFLFLLLVWSVYSSAHWLVGTIRPLLGLSAHRGSQQRASDD